MNKYKLLISIFVSGVILCGCSKNINNIYIIDEECIHNKDTVNTGNENKNTSKILFTASVESVNSTKSITSMASNEYAYIYSYQNNPADLSSPYEKVIYKTISPGMLSPVQKDTLFLPSGKYSFYSISTNSDLIPPEFTNGYSNPLSNGIDYLWWRAVNFEVHAPLVVIPVYFTHSSTQIIIKISAGRGVKLNQLVKSEIYPSAAGASMNELTGIIPQTDKYDKQIVVMGRKEFLSQYTMLPIKTDSPMTGYFTVRINDELQSRIYKSEIKLPADGLEGGKSYLFDAVINSNQIEFRQVNVIDWVVVDQTGSPLYPSQI